MLQSIIDYAFANPVQVLVVLYLCYIVYMKMQPFPDENGGPENVKDINEWNELLAREKVKRMFVR